MLFDLEGQMQHFSELRRVSTQQRQGLLLGALRTMLRMFSLWRPYTEYLTAIVTSMVQPLSL